MAPSPGLAMGVDISDKSAANPCQTSAGSYAFCFVKSAPEPRPHQVDAGADAGAGPDGAVVYVDVVRFELHLRERARELLKQLEETGNNFEHPSLKKKRQNPGQLKMFDDSPNPALSALRDLKVDDLSPIEALTKLYELKRLAADER